MKKNSINVSIESDFNAKIILDKLKKFNLKNFLIKPKVNNFENININLNHQTKKNEFVFFVVK